ncbi:MAG: CDP-diacylglycerol--glycerol-3-phosphate 3-phosphatidyltransferase [Phycisphaerales bacterium]|nr:CDP-diacylglycerol--glycerol-3-phosphate 3-phosphatidyltransferase [Phycisphaerales bacterium]
MAQMQTMMQATQQDRKVHIPNLLTMGRVGLAMVFVGLLSSVSAPVMNAETALSDRIGQLSSGSTTILIIATAVFIIAALTDALDGHLARKWKAETKFGRIMDPFADKLLILGGFVMLAGPNFVSPLISGGSMQLSAVAGWMVVAMIARELLVTSIRGMYESEGVDFSAGSMGKAKMVLQSITIPIILLVIAFGSPGPESGERTIIVLLVWATVVVTLVSGLPYVGKALQHTIDENAKMMEIMRGKKAGKSTKSAGVPGAKNRPKSNKGGQSKKRR